MNEKQLSKGKRMVGQCCGVCLHPYCSAQTQMTSKGRRCLKVSTFGSKQKATNIGWFDQINSISSVPSQSKNRARPDSLCTRLGNLYSPSPEDGSVEWISLRQRQGCWKLYGKNPELAREVQANLRR